MTSERDDECRERAIERTRREWCHAGRFHRPIEGRVKRLEALVVRTVTWTMHVEECHDQAWLVLVSTDSACGLDVLGGRLRLTEHDHQPEARDVQADRDHVRRQRDVYTFLRAVLLREADGQTRLRRGHLVGAFA